MKQADAIGSALEQYRERGVLHRGPDDDFFCLRFRVWYPSIDCAVRTKFKTCGGCLDCDQGRFNLRRHLGSLDESRFAERHREVAAESSTPPAT